MSRGRILPVGLFALLLIQITRADDTGRNLNNREGETPCQMKDVVASCSQDLSSRGIFQRDRPGANGCTCNNVFWNLWSACLISQNDANSFGSLTSAADWDSMCSQNNLQFKDHTTDEERWKDMDIPSWAYNGLPSNRSQIFNIGVAISVASPSPDKWTTIQIVVPIVSGVAVAVICGIMVVLYRRNKSGKGGVSPVCAVRRKIRDGFGTRRVRKGSRNHGWVIDSREDESFEVVDPESPKTSRSSYGHVRLSSSPTDISFIAFPDSQGSKLQKSPGEKAEWAMPGKRLWKRSSLIEKLKTTWLLLPVPWKSTPVAVHSAMPSRRFQIDESSKSVRTDSTLENYRRGGFRTSSHHSGSTESGPATTSAWDYTMQETIYEADEEEDDLDSILGFGGRGGLDNGDDDESEHLISERNQDVLIISHSGQDFSMESGDSRRSIPRALQIIPPSPITPSSPPATPQPPRSPPVAKKPKASIATINTPPAPSYPAPLPPASPPRSPPRQPRPSIENLLDSAASSPPSSSPIPHSITSLPASESPLPSPRIPDIATPTPLYTPRQQHSRSISQQASSSSLRPPLPLPPSLSPRLNPSRLSRSTEQLIPPVGPREPTHSRNGSNASASQLSQYSLLCSPPYRASPLPDETLIARSESPPPPPSGGMGVLGLYEQQQAPPYHSNDHRRELPVAPNPTLSHTLGHRRALSADDPSLNVQYRGFGDIATLQPNGTTTPMMPPPPPPPPPPPLLHAQSSESLSLQYTSQMYPGPVRGAVSTESVLLPPNGSDLTETPRTVVRDARWYPEPSIA
ncbi:hypothetical protein WG66_006461 [Moniliophthora roreri]|nr:hypothetical protein WG66_006461 [Moniliophthora roreri]